MCYRYGQSSDTRQLGNRLFLAKYYRYYLSSIKRLSLNKFFILTYNLDPFSNPIWVAVTEYGSVAMVFLVQLWKDLLPSCHTVPSAILLSFLQELQLFLYQFLPITSILCSVFCYLSAVKKLKITLQNTANEKSYEIVNTSKLFVNLCSKIQPFQRVSKNLLGRLYCS